MILKLETDKLKVVKIMLLKIEPYLSAKLQFYGSINIATSFLEHYTAMDVCVWFDDQ